VQIIIKIVNYAPAAENQTAPTETTESNDAVVELPGDEWTRRQEALNQSRRAA
jgi:hypothetical protein